MAGYTQLTGSLGSLLTLVILSLTINPAGGISISLVLDGDKPILMNVHEISGQIISFSWYKGAPVADNQILYYLPSSSPPQINGTSYIPDATAYPNATLSIPRAEEDYDGIYTVKVQTGTIELQADVTLTREVILSLLKNPARGISISQMPSTKVLGKTVFLNVYGISGQIISFSWYKDAPSADNQILNYLPTSSPPQTNGKSYIPDATAYANATLSIPCAKEDHVGVYIVQVQTNIMQVQADVTLTKEAFLSQPKNSTGGIRISQDPSWVVNRYAVLLNVTGIPGEIISFSWYKKEPSAANQILNYLTAKPPQINGRSYIPRAITYPDATLSIPRAEGLAGVYTLQVQTNTIQLQASTTLDPNCCTAGEIVCIVFGVLELVCACVAVVVWYLKCKKKPENNAERPKDFYANVDKSDNE